jgi:uncharacterized surface protein with fasciclin (FAS1) repeats
MKFRLLSVAALLVLALLAVVPGFAQEMEPSQSIAEIVIASAGASDAQFTVLLAAVQAADPSIVELLLNPDASVTVFAPTDAAFVAAFEALGVTAEDVLANTALLNAVLLYHVVPAAFDAEAVVALDGALVGTLLAENALMISVSEGGVMVNDANVVATDIMATNGIVHVIDAVLLPNLEAMADMDMSAMMEATDSIADIVVASAGAEAAEFTVLLAAVQAADPSILATLAGDTGVYTVFAPTDAAFGALLEALGVTAEQVLADTDLLNTVLAYHVVPGYLSSTTAVAVAGMMDEVKVATLLPGTTVTLMLDGETLMVNDAAVVATDVVATNGIIHVIDAVLLPPM